MWMIKNIGLSAIPPSAFYSGAHKECIGNYVRFCFFKKDENLRKAEEMLTKWVNK